MTVPISNHSFFVSKRLLTDWFNSVPDSGFKPSAEDTSNIAYFRNSKFHFLFVALQSYFPASVQYSSQLRQHHYNLHRNPFKEFVHTPLVDFTSRRDTRVSSTLGVYRALYHQMGSLSTHCMLKGNEKLSMHLNVGWQPPLK